MLSKGFKLSNYAEIDSGYSFLAWNPNGTSDGWAAAFPIYISNPLEKNGTVFWNGNIPTGDALAVRFYYFLIKN